MKTKIKRPQSITLTKQKADTSTENIELSKQSKGYKEQREVKTKMDTDVMADMAAQQQQ